MRLRQTVLGVLLLLLATSGAAQTSTRVLQWDQPGATVAEAMACTYTVAIDAAAPVGAPQSCTLAGTMTRCTTPITYADGPHTIVVTGRNGFGAASSAPLSGAPPVPAVNVTVIVTVTVP